MQTTMPANRTARPDVSSDVTTRGFGVAAGEQTLPVPRHDEQGVVDAHAQADQQDQLGGEDRHLEDVAQQPDDRDGRAERDQGGQQREQHAKSDPNTTNRTMAAAMIPTPVPPTAGLFACSAICPETEIFSPSPAAPVAVFTKCLRLRDGELRGILVEADDGEGDGPVPADLTRSLRGRTGTRRSIRPARRGCAVSTPRCGP